MPAEYHLREPGRIPSPALLFYKEYISRNVQRMLAIAGHADRLRPHAKTHKCAEITRMELAHGITKHKCATLAEAEMLARCGVPDVLIAYAMVGPNQTRLGKLIAAYPQTRFAVLADHPGVLPSLSATMQQHSVTVEVLLDVNVGQNRTGIAPHEALQLYEMLTQLPGLHPGGLHIYDGHNIAADKSGREQMVKEVLAVVQPLRQAILDKDWPLPRLVFGGTPPFLLYAGLDMEELECSPGTCVLHDANYSREYPEQGFLPAALLITRVVSRPTADRVTLDLGTKAVCSDPPAGKRCVVLGLENAVAVAHNEEHLVLKTPDAEKWQPGDVAYAMPAHVCPTVALHRWAHVVEHGKVVDRWEIVARDREITI